MVILITGKHRIIQFFFWENKVLKDLTNSQSGSASAKLNVITKTIPVVVTSHTLTGVLTLGKLIINIAAQTASVTDGTTFAGTPTKLTGFIKYQPVKNDFLALGWGLTKWNTGILDTNGFGALSVSATLNL